MAHSVVTQVIEQGAKFVVVKVTIMGDGSSGELTKATLFDASAYSSHVNEKIIDVEYCLNGFTAVLYWKATADVQLLSLTKDHPSFIDYLPFNGLPNPNGAGTNGDILITTTGLASKTYDGHITIRLAWKDQL